MMRLRRLRSLGVALAIVLAAAGCSSAKHVSKTSGNGTGTNGSSAPSGATAAAKGGSGSTAARSFGVVRNGAQGEGPAARPPGVTSRYLAATGPGVTRRAIYIGVGWSSQSAQADKALGAGSAGPSYDTRNVLNAVISYANRHGGFAGRVLKPLYYDYNVTTDISTQDQSACAYWTQDNKVFAITAGTDIRDACAEKAHAIPMGAGSATSETYRKYPHLIDTAAIAFDRLGAVTVSGLYKAGYFTGKLGIVTWDDPNYRLTIAKGYMPALSSRHITPLRIAYITVPQQFGSISDSSAQIASEVAKFKALGIDHVIIQDGPAGVFVGDGISFEWMNYAKSQNYKPRYGGNTYLIPGDSIKPDDQQDHELAIDDSDIDPANDAGWHANTARQLCWTIEADAGYPVNPSNGNDEAVAGASCDSVFLLQRVINASQVVSNDAFIETAAKLGTSFRSALVYGTKLFPGRRDGSDMVRTEEYFSSCKCVKYQGPPKYAD